MFDCSSLGFFGDLLYFLWLRFFQLVCDPGLLWVFCGDLLRFLWLRFFQLICDPGLLWVFCFGLISLVDRDGPSNLLIRGCARICKEWWINRGNGRESRLHEASEGTQGSKKQNFDGSRLRMRWRCWEWWRHLFGLSIANQDIIIDYSYNDLVKEVERRTKWDGKQSLTGKTIKPHTFWIMNLW